MIARAVAVLGFVAVLGCSSKKEGAVAWPDLDLVETTARVGGGDVTLLIPNGVGRYDDPGGIIWRDVSTDFAFFIKVLVAEQPASLAEAIEGLYLEENQKVIVQNELADGFEVVVEEPENKRHTIYLWRERAGHSISCTGILGRKLGDAVAVDKSSRWITKICRSLTLR